MAPDDKERQRARFLRGAAREDEHRANRAARRRRGDDARAPGSRSDGRRVEDWLDGAEDDVEQFERIARGPTTRSGARRATPGGARFAGTVVAGHRDAFEVSLDRRSDAGDEKVVRVPRRANDDELVVGDAVELTVDPTDGSWHVATLGPRRTLLDRPDPGDPRRRLLLAANVDVVVAVQAADRPRPGLVDRIALATARTGARLVVCLNKVDRADASTPTVERALRDVAALHGARFVAVSATTGAGVDALRDELRGARCVFVGPSGVGKSSLCNALAPSLGLRVAAVRDADQKGRHTTTTASLHRLPGDITLIDTPGVRAFGLGPVSVDELAAAFPDVAHAARACRFRDCTHDGEPGCGVREAIADGRLRDARLAAWQRMRAPDPP